MNRINVMILASFTMLVGAVHAMHSTVMTEVASPFAARAHALPLELPALVPSKTPGEPDNGRFIAWLEPGVTTRESQVGDAIVARLERPLRNRGSEIAPAGATVVGHVLACAPLAAGDLGPRLLVRASVLPTGLTRARLDSLHVRVPRG